MARGTLELILLKIAYDRLVVFNFSILVQMELQSQMHKLRAECRWLSLLKRTLLYIWVFSKNILLRESGDKIDSGMKHKLLTISKATQPFIQHTFKP